MKKILFALMAFVAIMMTSCAKHETCTLVCTNEYSRIGLIFFSSDRNCDSEDACEYYAKVEPGKTYSMKNAKLDGLYAIFYVGTGEVDSEGYERVARVGDFDLNQYVGMGTVTCKITSNGLYGVEASNF